MQRQFALVLLMLVVIVPWGAAAEPRDRPVELLVRGDDMGHSLDVNQAFIKAHTEGIVTSASLMPPALYFDDAVARCQDHPTLCPGIHVMLMATVPMRPLSPPDEVSSLIAPNGFFYRGLEDFSAAQPKIEDVEKEVRAQIKKCLGTGLRFVYLDWHMASDGGGKRPDIVALFQRLCREYRLLYTHDAQDIDGRYSGAKYFGANLEAWGTVRLPDGKLAYWCGPDLPEKTRLKFLDTLRNLPPGTWYTVCHPGTYARRQAQSVAVLCSQDVKDILRQRNIHLISYADLRQRQFGDKEAAAK
ncbi:MAG: ChbG/HpnK family deacetylase [Planctomycetota bacterium]|nr:ChbG/HpnK family deacetylase [Planctomycetota bacterium]